MVCVWGGGGQKTCMAVRQGALEGLDLDLMHHVWSQRGWMGLKVSGSMVQVFPVDSRHNTQHVSHSNHNPNHNPNLNPNPNPNPNLETRLNRLKLTPNLDEGGSQLEDALPDPHSHFSASR
jgi:hypothetical protein